MLMALKTIRVINSLGKWQQATRHMSETPEQKFMSRKFMMVTGINALSTLMLVCNKLGAPEWVDTAKWSLSTYMAANVIGDKISFLGIDHKNNAS